MKPRIMLYSHDTFGLGHLRRSLSIAHAIAQAIPKSHQLLVTGSMVAGAFALPPRLDMIKLPALSKRSSGQYKARTLPLTLKQTLTWREQLLLQAAQNFKPDLLLVDKVAAGTQGELLPTLRYLRAFSPETKIVLGMRDIEDSPAVTRREWASQGVTELLEATYDAILLYGRRELFDPLTAYGMSPQAAAKVIECGYLRRDTVSRPAAAVRRELDVDRDGRKLVVVTVGGGGDGYDVIRSYLDALPLLDAQNKVHSVIVTGPLMAERKRKLLRRAVADGRLPVTILEFTADLTSYLQAADLVVSMAGYNTVCEIMSLQRPSLLIPRRHVRAEQRIRAKALAERGLARCLPPEELTPERLAAEIAAALAEVKEVKIEAAASQPKFDLDGLNAIAAAVQDLLAGRRPPFPPASPPASVPAVNPYATLSTPQPELVEETIA